MSECYLTRCQQDRKQIRREFNKWTKNILLQIGLETISKNHFQYNINSFHQTNDERSPNDFNSNQICLFCINRQEYLINQDKTHLWLNEDTDLYVNNEENSPLDLSLKSTPNDLKSDILPIYNQEDFLLSNHMNFDYLSQYETNSVPLRDIHVAQLAKQMAYSRMIEEIEYQRNNNTPKMAMNFFDTSSMNVSHLLNDIMIRILTETFQKQQTRQGELLFVKKQNKHSKQLKSTSSSSSSTSGLSSIQTKCKLKSKSSTHIPSRQPREIISNSKLMADIDGKQSRPKRGHYRRYESEQLSKAVTAVLSNEMSVHKAGSYFGVPHSTLEYKVKERTAKVSTTTKKTNDKNISQSKSMEYDDLAQLQSNSSKSPATNKQHLEINDENECDDKEIHSYIPIELEIN